MKVLFVRDIICDERFEEKNSKMALLFRVLNPIEAPQQGKIFENLSLSLSLGPDFFLFVGKIFILHALERRRQMMEHQNDHRDQKGGGGGRSVKTLFAGDKVKQMKEKAGKMSALSSAFAKTVKKTTSTMKIPQLNDVDGEPFEYYYYYY